MEKFRKIIREPVYLGIFIFIFIGAFIAFLDIKYQPSPEDILVEAHGLLMDIALFAIVLVYFTNRRNKDDQAREYKDNIIAFSTWGEREGVLRKIYYIKRLIEMGEKLPDMLNIQLQNADLKNASLQDAKLLAANLEGANLQFAHLERAALASAHLLQADIRYSFLEGANFRKANLTDALLLEADLKGADLQGADMNNAILENTNFFEANLQGAKNLTVEQLESAKINKGTILPNYLKIIWNDDGTLKEIEYVGA